MKITTECKKNDIAKIVALINNEPGLDPELLRKYLKNLETIMRYLESAAPPEKKGQSIIFDPIDAALYIILLLNFKRDSILTKLIHHNSISGKELEILSSDLLGCVKKLENYWDNESINMDWKLAESSITSVIISILSTLKIITEKKYHDIIFDLQLITDIYMTAPLFLKNTIHEIMKNRIDTIKNKIIDAYDSLELIEQYNIYQFTCELQADRKISAVLKYTVDENNFKPDDDKLEWLNDIYEEKKELQQFQKYGLYYLLFEKNK